MSNSTNSQWKHLAPDPRGRCKQLYIKGRKIRAWTLYGYHVTKDLFQTPEEIAEEFELPLEAVHEAIAYCEADPPEIKEDFEEEDRWFAERGLDKPHPLSPAAARLRAQSQSS